MPYTHHEDGLILAWINSHLSERLYSLSTWQYVTSIN
jgi:hypothetical protein